MENHLGWPFTMVIFLFLEPKRLGFLWTTLMTIYPPLSYSWDKRKIGVKNKWRNVVFDICHCNYYKPVVESLPERNYFGHHNLPRLCLSEKYVKTTSPNCGWHYLTATLFKSLRDLIREIPMFYRRSLSVPNEGYPSIHLKKKRKFVDQTRGWSSNKCMKISWGSEPTSERKRNTWVMGLETLLH